MKFKSLIFIPLLVPLFTFSCNNTTEAEVILLSGQSNMEGFDSPYSELDKDTISYYTTNTSNVKISYDCTYDYAHKKTDKPYSSLGEFVDVNFGQRRNKDLFGPEVGLAKYLATNSPNKKYYLIKSCEGGTKLKEVWCKDGRCYNTFVDDVHKSLDNLSNQNIKFKITAMIWMQGEADSEIESYSKEYLDNEKDLINRVLTEFKDYIDTKSFKWIDSGISTDGKWPYATLINNAKREIVLSNDNYRYTWQSESLEKINEYHYTAKGYLKLGECYGYNYLN